MKRSAIFCCLLFASVFAMVAFAQKPASVFLTAGQSNADGREYVNKLPYYLKGGYQYLKYTNVTSSGNGEFGQRTFESGTRFAFCDITHYFIEKALQTDFYGIKCAYGGTAIDTAATYAHLPVWCADAEWIARNNAYRGDIETGKSLTKSLTEGFSACVNTTLGKLGQGYDVKAIMWHQGESDRSKAGNYYKNFKDMILYMRNSVYEMTGKEKDKSLPFVFGTVPRNSKQYSSGVEAAQLQVAAELPNVYYIDMSDAGLRSDALHFDSAWTEYLGKKMYNVLVQIGAVEGEEIDVVKPHIPTASDTLQVESERQWDFAKAWSQASADSLAADASWPVFQSLGHRYSSAIGSWQELATSKGYAFPETRGLFFKCSSGNRAIIKPGQYLCFYGDNLYLMIPKVKPGQTVTIVTASAKGERGITTDSGDYLELVSGGVRSTSKLTNTWKVKETLTEPVDLVFHSDGGAIYVYSIEVTSPYVPILVGADQKVMFSSSKACNVAPYADLISAYVATGYDASTDVITLQRVDTIPANTGVMIAGEECLIGAPQVSTGKTYPGNLFVAVVDSATVQPTETIDSFTYSNYMLQPLNGTVDFHRIKSATVLSGQAYLRLLSDAAIVKTNLDNSATGINATRKTTTDKPGVWYDTRGIAVSRPTTTGFYVYNGKKYRLTD